MKHSPIIFITALLLSACSTGSNFTSFTTKADNAGGFINASLTHIGSESMNHWWESINDPLLNSYVQQLLNENLSLIEANERVIQANEGVNIKTGSYYPTLGSNVQTSRSFSSSDLTGNNRVYSTNHTASLTSSWELDLFGRIRNSVTSSKNNFEATAYDKQALTHSLIANLVNLRVEIATNNKLLSLSKQNVDTSEQLYDLLQKRYDLGASSITLETINLAKNSLNIAKEKTHRNERILAEATYRLDIILGQKPGTTNPTQTDFPLIATPINVPVCLPASLLDRRPDLLASQLRIKASEADIKVAVADLYPSISLGSSIGFSDNSTPNLFSAQQLAGSIIGSITTRIFEGGKLRANIRIKESKARELIASYSNNVLNAMKEVETSLKSGQELTKELELSKQSFDALSQNEQNVTNRYNKGIKTLKNTLDAQQLRYSSEERYTLLQQQKWSNRIALYKALGGDWLEQDNNNSCKQVKQIGDMI